MDVENNSSEYLTLIRQNVIRYAASRLIKGRTTGIRYIILKYLINLMFRQFIDPVLGWSWREGIINLDIMKMKYNLDNEDETHVQCIKDFKDIP